jgi:hypothetical protein
MAETILELKLRGVDTARKRMDDLTESIEIQKKKQRELKKEIKELEKSLDGEKQMSKETMDALADKNLQLEASRKQTQEYKKELRQTIRVEKAQQGTLEANRATLAKLKTEYAKINTETEEGARTAALYEDRIGKLNKKVKEQEKRIGDTGRNVGNYEEAIKDAVSSMIPFSGQLTEIASSGGGVKGTLTALTTGIQGATRSAIAFISTGIGAVIAALAGIGLATKAFIDYNAEVEKTNALISGLTNESGELVDQIRIQSDAISKTLGVEQEQLVQSAKVLVQQFGLSYEEALDKIQNGLLATNGTNEEFLQSIGEYSTFFSQAGYSVEEFANIVNAGFDLGIYSDKLPDALKEADISLREQTKATRDALENAFGPEFTQTVLDQVNTGAITTKQALEMIAEQSEKVVQKNGEIGLSSEQAATLTADVFRGAGEDAGGALKVFEAVNVSLQEQTSQLDEQGIRLQQEIERQQEVAAARDRAMNSESVQSFMKVLKDLAAFFTKVFFGTIELFATIVDVSIIQPIEFVVRQFNNLKEAASSALAPLKSITDALGVTSKETDKANKSTGDFIKTVLKQKEAQEQANIATEKAAIVLDEARERAEGYVEALQDIVKQQERQPLLMSAEDIFSERTAETITQNLQYISEQIEANANLTSVNVEGITVSVEEYAQLAQNALNNLQKAEEDAQRASEKRSEDRQKQREKDAEEQAKLAQKALEDQLKLEEEERLANQKRIDDNIQAVKDQYDSRLEAIQQGLSMEMLVKETAHLDDLRTFIGTEEEKLALQKQFNLENLELQKQALQDQMAVIEQTLAEGDLLAMLETGILDESTKELAELRNAIAGINLEIQNAGKDPESGEPKTLADRLGLNEKQVERINKGVAGVEAGLDAMSQLVEARAQERFGKVDQLLQQGVINEEEAERRKEQIKKDAARKQQKIDITQAVINTAKAVTSALNTQPFLPAGLIMAGIATAQGAAQIKMIKSQKFAKGGILNGPSHAQGGIPMFSKGGAFYGEAEGGEAVMTKGVMANPALASMASAINVAGGGVPFFANGGVLDPIQSATPTDRAADIISAGLKSRQPVLVVEQLRERENSVDVIESLRTIG